MLSRVRVRESLVLPPVPDARTEFRPRRSTLGSCQAPLLLTAKLA